MLASAPAWAQTGLGTIVGTVTDASTKQPVADVVVTATAPTLPGEQIVVTGADGQFRIPQLPAGTYSLRFDKESYRPFVRGGVPLRIDTTVRVNVELLPETAGETTIVVEDRAPTIDVGSATTGVNVSADMVRNLAVLRPGGKSGATRSFEGLLSMAPGANNDAYGVSIAGTTSPENSYTIDGLSVNDPAYGINGSQMSVEFVQDVNVATGGFMPEYGRSTGGVASVVTKSGSNEFHGSVFATWVPGVFQAESRSASPSVSSIRTTTKVHNVGDFGATLGGPIVKDKLWFFVGFNPGFQRHAVNVSYWNKVDANNYADEAYSSYRRFADNRTFQYFGKLTYTLNQDHSFTASVFGAPWSAGGGDSFGYDPQTNDILGRTAGDFIAGTPVTNSNSLDVILKANNAFLDKRVLLETTLGWHHQSNSRTALDGSGVRDTADHSTLAGQPAFQFVTAGIFDMSDFAMPGLRNYEDVLANCQITGSFLPCPVNSWVLGGLGYMNDTTMNRYSGKSVATFIFDALGTHAAKIGIDAEHTAYNHLKGYAGTAYFQETSGYALAFEARNYATLTGPGNDLSVLNRLNYVDTTPSSTNIGAFIQDSWNVADLFTINAGIRYDNQTLTGADGRIGLALPSQISPRVGLIFDPTQDGRSKIFANYARFFETVPLNIGDRAFGGESQVVLVHWLGPDCDPLGNNGDTAHCLQNNDFYPYAGDPNQSLSYAFLPVGTGRATVDPDLKPQSTDEILVGGEYQIIDNGRLGAQYTRRSMNRIIEDMSRDEATSYFIGNPGEGIASDFPKPRRDYDAVNVYFTKDFADLWLAQVSYTWSYNRGNWAGLFRPETEQLDPNLNSDYDLTSLLVNRDGPLPVDRTHVFKLFAAKEFVFAGAMGINLGVTYQYQSGAPLSAYGRHSVYGLDEIFILPRGALGRSSGLHSLDGTIAFNVKLSESNTLSLGMDVFNLFNWAQPTGWSQRYTAERVLPIQGPDTPTEIDPSNPDDLDRIDSLLRYEDGSAFDSADRNPNFGQVTGYQAPRQVRFSARFTF
ncbi:MAG TPA: TonB-dependent receptor [Myxococcaceae bacterium]|nr:TonB-dependent receptor [Myxococcaceae bacterium]